MAVIEIDNNFKYSRDDTEHSMDASWVRNNVPSRSSHLNTLNADVKVPTKHRTTIENIPDNFHSFVSCILFKKKTLNPL